MSKGLRNVVYDHLCNQLLTGVLRAGSRVCELTVAKETGVSRSPVREAIGQLRTEGVLDHVAGYGAFVKSPTREELDEAFQVREWLECEAIHALASMKVRPSLGLARSGCDKMLEMLKADQSGEGSEEITAAEYDLLERLDRDFHAAMLHAAGNRRVVKIINDSRLLIHATACGPSPLTHDKLSEIFSDHDVILRTVERGDADRARDLMLDHVRWAHTETMRVYDELAALAEEDEHPADVARRIGVGYRKRASM